VSSNGLSCHHQTNSRVVNDLSRHHQTPHEPQRTALVPAGSTRLSRRISHVCRLNNVRLDNLRSTSVGSTTFVTSTTFVDLTTDSDFDVQIVKRIPASCCDNTRRPLSHIQLISKDRALTTDQLMTRSCANHMIITRATGCHAQPFRLTEHELVCDCTHKRCTEKRCNLS